MRVYENSLGITVVEPDKGYLLKKGNTTCKMAYLGKNDRAELYEQILDESEKPKEENSIVISDDAILTSSNGRRFKLIVNNDGTLATREI